jgi:hypothetical protein
MGAKYMPIESSSGGFVKGAVNIHRKAGYEGATDIRLKNIYT